MLWRGVHHRLITYMADTLSQCLPPRYLADIEERLYVVQSFRALWPDVLVKRRPRTRVPVKAGPALRAEGRLGNGDEPVLLSIEPAEIAEAFIEIRVAGDKHRVVTVIEFLSPSNKSAGTPGRSQYLKKQRRILRSRTHLLEIDLLRRGLHTVAAPLDLLTQQATWDYLISLQRGGHDTCEAWPVTLRQRLPRVRVPLEDKDPDIHIDLQQILDHCYDLGNYSAHLDYRRTPVVPLPREDAAWADQLLRKQGLRGPRREPRKKDNHS